MLSGFSQIFEFACCATSPACGSPGGTPCAPTRRTMSWFLDFPTSSRDWFHRRTIAVAFPRNLCPASVKLAPLLLRSNNWQFKLCSRVRMRMLTVDCVTCTTRDAPKKLPVSTTAKNVGAQHFFFHFLKEIQNFWVFGQKADWPVVARARLFKKLCAWSRSRAACAARTCPRLGA